MEKFDFVIEFISIRFILDYYEKGKFDTLVKWKNQNNYMEKMYKKLDKMIQYYFKIYPNMFDDIDDGEVLDKCFHYINNYMEYILIKNNVEKLG